ncbi:hypothetical protein [uncultured Methanobrevibacter sp.]|uniref:hypothetical protein n=1 Tax=uncultured Methanobrevibacter sp. TaxID=253161 RepID=UPI0025CE86C3|nr:hypothetical protein [uncultured Methanobrevibacter sp.]
MDAINVINQNKILVDVLYRGNVNLIDIVIGDALVYDNPTVAVRCYTTDLAFATSEIDEIVLEDEEFELLITYEDGEFSILLKTHNLGELGYIEWVI